MAGTANNDFFEPEQGAKALMQQSDAAKPIAPAAMSNWRLYPWLQGALWGGYFLTNVAFTGGTSKINGFFVAVFFALSFLLWLCTHGMRALYHRFIAPLGFKTLVLHLLWFIPLAAALIQLALLPIGLGLAKVLTPPNGMLAPKLALLAIYWFNTMIMLSLWSLGFLFWQQFRRTRRAEIAHWQTQAQLHQTQLQFLRSQINSHFLFNALNNLRALIRVDPELARTRITQLANVLRAILQSEQIEQIPLQEELDIVRAYLDMETLQYDQRLQVQWQIDPETLGCVVPALSVQTLVENAIKHGIACRSDGGTIVIRAQLAHGQLQLEVHNPPAQNASAHTGNGIGLRNVRARLLHSGAGASIELVRQGELICARMLLPQANRGARQ